MPMIHSPTGSALHPYEFSDRVLLGIGRLIRVCADLEDALTVYMSRATGISEGIVSILIGKTPISAKLRIAGTIALSKNELDAFKSYFGKGLSDCLKCRNAAAHGTLLGQTDEGWVAFAVSEPVQGEDIGVTTVRGFEEKAFDQFAVEAAKVLKLLDEQLQLPALREARREQPLDPHPKAQKARESGSPPPPPPA